MQTYSGLESVYATSTLPFQTLLFRRCATRHAANSRRSAARRDIGTRQTHTDTFREDPSG